MTDDFPRLFSAAHGRWVRVVSITSRTPYSDFAAAVGKSTKAVANWCNKNAPPETSWARVKSVLRQHGNSDDQIEEIDRAWRAQKGLPPRPGWDLAAGGHQPDLTRAPWFPADDHYRRIDGFADIDAHPPESETEMARFPATAFRFR